MPGFEITAATLGLGLFVLALVLYYRRTHDRASTSQPNEQKRDCSLPPGCKDLIDVIRRQPETGPAALPPITQHVTLPDILAVRYLAELLQLSTDEVSALSGYYGSRSVPFDEAQRILRTYGIWADKGS